MYWYKFHKKTPGVIFRSPPPPPKIPRLMYGRIVRNFMLFLTFFILEDLKTFMRTGAIFSLTGMECSSLLKSYVKLLQCNPANYNHTLSYVHVVVTQAQLDFFVWRSCTANCTNVQFSAVLNSAAVRFLARWDISFFSSLCEFYLHVFMHVCTYV